MSSDSQSYLFKFKPIKATFENEDGSRCEMDIIGGLTFDIKNEFMEHRSYGRGHLSEPDMRVQIRRDMSFSLEARVGNAQFYTKDEDGKYHPTDIRMIRSQTRKTEDQEDSE